MSVEQAPAADTLTAQRPTPPAGPRFALRAATAAAHEKLDALYSSFDLGERAGYGAFLLAHAPAFVAVEDALDAAGAERLVPGWRVRRRSQSLRRDIAALGLEAPAISLAPDFGTEARLLGGLYVLEGSRLGGAVLVRTVGPGLPTGFLTPGNPADWRAFIALLEQRLSSPERLAGAVSAARDVFALFEQSARTCLETTGLDL